MAARKAGAIVETARQLFLDRGYDGTSLDDVAAASGVSKTTVYNNFADKEALFRAVVDGVTTESERIVDTVRSILDGEEPVEVRLRTVARRLAASVLEPRVMQLRRRAIAEAPRFPDVAEQYWRRAPDRALAALRDGFARLTADGDLDCDEPGTAAEVFAYSVLGRLQDRALLQPSRPISRAVSNRHADAAVDAFLRAFAPSRSR